MIEKIISGGQTGADLGGLIAAKELGIKTGGLAPKGYRTEGGSNYDLKNVYGLKESGSTGYQARTLHNVVTSDVTIIFAFKPGSSGTKMTIGFAVKEGKPKVGITTENGFDMLVEFLDEHNPSTVNIAGNRESVAPGIQEFTRSMLVRAILVHNANSEFDSLGDDMPINPKEEAMPKSVKCEKVASMESKYTAKVKERVMEEYVLDGIIKQLPGSKITALIGFGRELGVPKVSKYRKADEEVLRALVHQRALEAKTGSISPVAFGYRALLETYGPQGGGEAKLHKMAADLGMHRAQAKLEGFELIAEIWKFKREKETSRLKAQDAFNGKRKESNRKDRRLDAKLARGMSDRELLLAANWAEGKVDHLTECGELESEAKAFRLRLSKVQERNTVNNVVAIGPKVLSNAMNPISENDPKIRLHGISSKVDENGEGPKIAKVKGLKYTWDLVDEETKKYAMKEHRDVDIEVSRTSPFGQWCIAGDIIPVLIDVRDHDVVKAIYKYVQEKAFKSAGMFLAGNAKKSEPLFGAATLEMWKKLIGEDVRKYSNPNKPIGTFMTPHNYEVVDTQNAQYLRVRVINDEFFPESHVLNPITFKWEKHGGHAVLDGSLLTCLSAWYTPVAEIRRYTEEMATYEIKRQRGEKCRKPKAIKETRANANAQIRTHHIIDEDDTAVYKTMAAENKDVIVFEPGEIIHSAKVKMNMDSVMYEAKVLQYGYDIHSQDAIMGISNFKTQKDRLKHGDIVMIPITPEKPGIRFVNIMVSEGKSSMGVQSIRLQADLVRQILSQALPKAETVKWALLGDAQSVLAVLQSDTEAGFEDAPKQPAQSIGCAFPDVAMPSGWRVPMHESQYNVILARIYTYLIQNVYKVRMSNLGAYLECNEDLDRMEREHFMETGEWVYFTNLPYKKKVIKEVEAGMKINIGRNPIVGSGNFMEFLFAGWNGSTDSVQISARALWTMFGDVDGDKCIILFHETIAFPTVVRELDISKPSAKKDIVLPTPEEFSEICIKSVNQILDSALDTGRLDNLSRQIITENWAAGTPLTPVQILEMGVIVQLAIDGMKHSDVRADEDAGKAIVRKYGVNGKIKKVAFAPQEYTALRPDGGISGLRGNYRLCMEAILRKLKGITTTQHNPYNEILGVLRDSTAYMIHSDSETIQIWCQQEWREIVEQHTSNTPKGVDPKAYFGWTPDFIIKIGDALCNGHSNFYKINIEGYFTCSRELSRDKKLARDKKQRRLSFAALHQEYTDYVELATQHAINSEYISDESATWSASTFKYQLMCYVGTKAFGMNMRTNQETGRSKKTSRAGSLFWTFPMFDCILPFLEKVNGGNPFLGQVKEAIIKNTEKRLQAEADDFAGVDQIEL